MYSSQLLKGTFQTIILKLLSNADRMYGYEITQKVKLLSDGEVILSEGSLYPLLHKMEEEGLVSTSREKVGNRFRRYYAITFKGRQEGEAKVDEFARFVKTMGKLISPDVSSNLDAI